MEGREGGREGREGGERGREGGREEGGRGRDVMSCYGAIISIYLYLQHQDLVLQTSLFGRHHFNKLINLNNNYNGKKLQVRSIIAYIIVILYSTI